jgi:4-hydroxy-3-polyprenylbenzoate decarboxylase
MARIVVGISGASGAAVAVDALKQLHRAGAETHLVVSKWGAINLEHETGLKPRDLWQYVAQVHGNQDLAAPISSGSFRFQAMLVAPCSARTLATIAAGSGDNLLSRAADVTLKERRTLVLALREAPLSAIHLRNALEVSRAGGMIYPLVPTFYSRPTTVEQLTSDMAARLVDLCGIETDALPRWGEGLDLELGGSGD